MYAAAGKVIKQIVYEQWQICIKTIEKKAVAHAARDLYYQSLGK